MELAEAGVLDKYGVEMIGAKAKAVKMAEDRLLFKQAMEEIGLETPRSEVVGDMQDARARDRDPSDSRRSFVLRSRSAEPAAALLSTTKSLKRSCSGASISARFTRS